ncbi:MAG: SpoIIE family protein phosphatase [Desulfovibrio sp.]|nr:SpoIIE family protein phosphatase [Desulfovibrio sp.]
MTLRAKLALSVGLSVALSIALTLFLTWKNVSRAIISSEEAHFSSIAQALENNLESSYQEYLLNKVRVVMAAKQLMRSTAMDAREDQSVLDRLLPNSALHSSLSVNLLDNHDGKLAPMASERVSIELASVDELRRTGFPPLNVSPNELNAKQQTIANMLTSLPANGEFGLWQIKNVGNVLLFLLPLHPGTFGHSPSGHDRILISGLILHRLFDEAQTLLKNRLKATRHNFEKLSFYENGCLMLCDSKGQSLVQRGDSTPLQGKLEELFQQAHQDGNAKGHLSTDEAGEYLYHVAWIKSYHWYLLMAAPLEVLRSPSSALVSKLLLAGIFILLAAAVCTSLLVIHAMRPLHELRNCTSELAAMDPSSTSSLTSMEEMLSQKLNIQRHDELGDLARSFASMSHELIKNIRASIEAMTEQKRLEGELTAARDIQMGILPDLSATEPEAHFSIAAFLEPAREVGGDLYDCFSLSDGRKALALGDVSGKGVPAALFMTMSVTLIRSALHSGLDPAQALTQINHLLEEHNPGNMFVTLFLAIYNPATGELVYGNGGHCLPFILSADGKIRQFEHLSGPLVGVMPGVEYLQFTDLLAPNESCFLYTDGLTEAMNSDKELYGEERLRACLVANAKKSPDALHKAIFADICAFRGNEPPSDDITMMTICHKA